MLGGPHVTRDVDVCCGRSAAPRERLTVVARVAVVGVADDGEAHGSAWYGAEPLGAVDVVRPIPYAPARVTPQVAVSDHAATLPAVEGGSWKGPREAVRPIAQLLRALAKGDSSVALVSSMHPSVLSFWLAT